MSKVRILLVVLLILWVGLIFGLYYGVQKPAALQVGAGLLSMFWTLVLVGLIVGVASCLGVAIIRRFFPFLEQGERALLGTGLGLGIFGLAGFGLAAVGAARPLALLPILAGMAILAVWIGWLRQTKEDYLTLWQAVRSPLEPGLKWVPWLAIAALFLSFLLAFAPPADSFDALLYHLAVPASWLRDGGVVTPLILPHYWFPELVEGGFVWGLALGSETTAPLLHLSWGILTVGLVWLWAQRAWGRATGWRAVAVLISMPSLPLLAAWAYTDLALAYYCLGVLYLLWRTSAANRGSAWVLSGIFCGLAMGIKYTSFILPLVALGWLAWCQRRSLQRMLIPGAWFAAAALVVASPWYVRNWIWAGNPFYPFLLGGRSWDPFLAVHYARSGTGVGINLSEILLLPFTLTLGQRDANFFDGRIGPLWLLLLPVVVWVLWSYRRSTERWALFLPALFGAASLGIWVVGVVNTSSLWQSRLLYPALIPLASPAALAWESLGRLDFRRFRVSFVVNVLVFLSIAAGLLDFGLFVLVRNPLAAATGMTSRQAYFERFQPAYGDALTLVGQTPEGSRVLFLFEPRSFGMSRFVQPDPINENLDHDFYLYHTPEAVLRSWQARGFTYVLYQHAGDTLTENLAESERLFSMLEVAAQTPFTILYRIPLR